MHEWDWCVPPSHSKLVRRANLLNIREVSFRKKRTLAAESAAAAQTCCFFDAERVDAVLCDAMLPDGSGVELCRRLVAKKPALLVILASGYPLQLAAMLEEEFHFLGKPYSGELLMAALRFVFTNEPQTDERLRPHSIAESLQNVPG